MTIEEKLREIMISEELPDSEKLDRLPGLHHRCFIFAPVQGEVKAF